LPRDLRSNNTIVERFWSRIRSGRIYHKRIEVDQALLDQCQEEITRIRMEMMDHRASLTPDRRAEIMECLNILQRPEP
jgi:hypothetical protein